MNYTPYLQLESKLGVEFTNKDLLVQAFVHRSYLNEHAESTLHHNERLEYLGDAVLELAVTHFLYLAFPKRPEGQLTAFRAALVRTESISDAAAKLGFDNYLMLSRGEARDTGKARSYILANTFEAFVGALYLDQGYDVAEKFIGKQLFHKIEEIEKRGLWRDAKSYVQEKAQEVLSLTPSYIVLSEEGPDHYKTFIVGIVFGEDIVAEGNGNSKQEAQQSAAQAALEKMGWA